MHNIFITLKHFNSPAMLLRNPVSVIDDFYGIILKIQYVIQILTEYDIKNC
jgi:hypothetical protein